MGNTDDRARACHYNITNEKFAINRIYRTRLVYANAFTLKLGLLRHVLYPTAVSAYPLGLFPRLKSPEFFLSLHLGDVILQPSSFSRTSCPISRDDSSHPRTFF